MRLTRSQNCARKGGGDRRCLQLWPFSVPQFPHKGNEGLRPEATAEAPSSYDVTPRDH